MEMPFFSTPKELRAARKLAKERIRECRKLLRRGQRTLTKTLQAELSDTLNDVETALPGTNISGLTRASETLANLTEKHLGRYRKPAWRESTESIGIAIIVALLLRSFVVEAFKIPSGSMIPTLAIGDQIFVNKLLYGMRIPFTTTRIVDFALPKRGEVIVFVCPLTPHEDFIKRVIGLPGDKIEVKDGVIIINDKAVERTFLGQETHWDREQGSGNWYSFEAFAYDETIDGVTHKALYDISPRASANDYGPTTVPPDSLFMMGDNRDHSFDSRSWGAVPLSNVLGRSLFVWFSLGKDGLRWRRLGTWIE